jgi:hypothetical protein
MINAARTMTTPRTMATQCFRISPPPDATQLSTAQPIAFRSTVEGRRTASTAKMRGPSGFEVAFEGP